MAEIIIEKLKKFRQLLTQYKIDAYIIPHNDSHFSEYISSADERIAFISDFDGSAGFCFISQKEALLWTDSRYFLQTKTQLKGEWQLRKQMIGEETWIQYVQRLYQNITIGYDPALENPETAKSNQMQFQNIQLKPIDDNLVDLVWGPTKPSIPLNEIILHDVQYCGESAYNKIMNMGSRLPQSSKIQQTCTFIVTQLDQIAWLLNMRGSDIAYNPVFYSYVVINYQFKKDSNDVSSYTGTLYIIESKVSQAIQKYLKDLNFEIKPYGKIFEDLQKLTGIVVVQKNACNMRVVNCLFQANVIDFKNPIELAKAIKNPREVQGFVECNRRDGAAQAMFFCWLENELLQKQRKDLTEFSIAQKQSEFRKQQKLSMGDSFETISSIGSNCAIIHYSPTEQKCSLIDSKLMYLNDSGGQYLDGTTDTTRTFHFTQPSKEEKDSYTRVLLGNLDLERVQWPKKKKVSGSELDCLARRRLWEIGLDYGHGTGHGVGYFLCVHEGPHGISKVKYEVLEENMVVTDEPGYYKEDHYGIRIENDLIVVKSEYEGFMGFKNLTLVPYDRNLIDLDLLTKKDVEYINAYHQRVLQEVGPLLQEQNQIQALDWLKKRCAPLQ